VKELRFAQIGSGLMGKAYAPALAQIPMWYWPPAAMPRRTLMVDIDEKSARDNAVRYGYDRWAVGWQAAVEDPDVDVVLILVPNNLHQEIVLAAAAAGKHICCEKPLAMDAREAKAMYDAVEKAGVRHQTAFNWRFCPAVQTAKKMVADGTLGRIYDFRGWWLVAGGWWLVAGGWRTGRWIRIFRSPGASRKRSPAQALSATSAAM
jgi:predicted dehydrogenase